LTSRICNPRKKIQGHWLQLDDLTARLARLTLLNLRHASAQLTGLRRRLAAASPRMLLHRHRSNHEVSRQRLLTGMTVLMKNKRAHAMESTLRMDALNPLAILRRGYSVTRTLPALAVVTHPDQVGVGTEIETLVAGGRLLCTVKGKSSHGQENV
jgi:exodeoxyribonuclease VII large subunit